MHPGETGYSSDGEGFLLPATPSRNGKPLDGLSEAVVAHHVLSLIAKLPAKTPGVADIKKGAIALAQAGGSKLSKVK